ncbi:hypothetical protein RR46_14508 [Papilio xuthus]|uniref:Uncharacterized protein n=1 Tax=Papilio xuthus TaxID=66420 RepID=A0A194PE85_PAPXU|nr:hypothetical protein RR46_14508 [Papilio xuthus]
MLNNYFKFISKELASFVQRKNIIEDESNKKRLKSFGGRNSDTMLSNTRVDRLRLPLFYIVVTKCADFGI